MKRNLAFAVPWPQVTVMAAGTVAVGVGFQAVFAGFAGQLAAADLATSKLLAGLFFVGVAGNVVVYFNARRRNEAAAWSRYIIGSDWLAQLLVLSLLWTVGASMTEGSRHGLLASIGLASIPLSVLASIRPQAQRPLPLAGRVGPLVYPLGGTAYFLFHPVANNWVMAFMIGLVFALSLAIKQVLVAHLDAATNALRAEQELKARFLASASHDLEQPLQSAQLSLYHLEQHDSPTVRTDAIRRMGLAFAAMEAMVAQITGYLKLEGSGVQAANRKVALAGPIGRAIALNEALARLKLVELRASPTGLVAEGDINLIDRALGNFIDNAIRHAKARRILLAARRHHGKVRIWVIDDGEGIAEADRAGLFEDYAQGDHKGEVRGGYGLGLASARRMAELMGGRAGYDPRWRGGSAFFLELAMA